MTTSEELKARYARFERLQRAVNLSRNTREADRWSAEEWIKLYDAYAACGWDLTPDTWTAQQVSDALTRGLAPQWDEDGLPCEGKAFT